MSVFLMLNFSDVAHFITAHQNNEQSEYCPENRIFCEMSSVICYVYMLFFSFLNLLMCVSAEWRRLTGGSLAQLVSLWMLVLLQTKCSNKCGF